VKQPGEPVQDLALALAHVADVDGHRPGGPVARKHPASTVQDQPAWCRDDHPPDAVAHCELGIAVAGQHLQVPQARQQRDEQHQDDR